MHLTFSTLMDRIETMDVMKRRLLLFALVFLICGAAGAQVTLHSESFETDGEGSRYNSNTYSYCPTDPDYFLRTNTNPVLPTGGCATGFGSTLINLQGSFFWAGEDILSNQQPFPGNHAPGQITTQNINIAGYSSLTVSLYLATASNNGTRWETADSINIQAKIDGGTYRTVGRFMGDGISGGRLRIDANLDGAITGADPLTKCDTVAFIKYTFNIPGGGTSMNVRLDFDQYGGTEESAIDLIEVQGTLSPCIAPTITCPAAQSLALDASCQASLPNYTALGVVTGTCSPTVTQSPASGALQSGPGGLTVTLTATDSASQTASCSFTVTVNDVTPPSIVCAPNVTINTTPGLCSGTTTLMRPMGSDNCGALNANALNFDGVDDYVSLNDIDFASGAYTIEGWVNTTYADSTSSDIFNVYPTNNNGSTYVLVEIEGPTGLLRFLHRPQGGTMFGTNLYSPAPINDGQWHHFAVGRGTDSYLRMYVDGALVAITTAGVNSIPVGPAACEIGRLSTSARYLNGTLDEIAVWTNQRTQLQIQAEMNAEHFAQPGLVALYHFNQGIAGGNNAGITNAIDDSGNAQAGTLSNFALNGPTSNWVAGQAFGPSITGNNAPSTYPVGSTTVTWTATDGSGNTATCSHTVTVIDQQAPSVSCPANMTVSTSANSCDTVVNYAMPSATDNCGVASLSLLSGLASGSTFSLGVQAQTYIAEDTNGLADTCSFTVTVVDAVAPVAVCQNITVYLDTNGLVTVTAAAVDNGSTDNCAVDTLSATPSVFNSSNIGANAVVLTVADAAGNTATCTTTVTVVDTLVAVDDPLLGQMLFTASPNPAQDRLQVQVECKICGSKDRIALQLWSMNGQLLRTLPVTTDRRLQRLDLDLSGLAAGNYMLSLNHNGRALTRKVIKL